MIPSNQNDNYEQQHDDSQEVETPSILLCDLPVDVIGFILKSFVNLESVIQFSRTNVYINQFISYCEYLALHYMVISFFKLNIMSNIEEMNNMFYQYVLQPSRRDSNYRSTWIEKEKYCPNVYFMAVKMMFNHKHFDDLSKTFERTKICANIIFLRPFVVKRFAPYSGLFAVSDTTIFNNDYYIDICYRIWDKYRVHYANDQIINISKCKYYRYNLEIIPYGEWVVLYRNLYCMEMWEKGINWNKYFIVGGSITSTLFRKITIDIASDVDIFSVNVYFYKEFIKDIIFLVLFLIKTQVVFTFESFSHTIVNITLYKAISKDRMIEVVRLQFVWSRNNVSSTLHSFDFGGSQCGWLLDKQILLGTGLFKYFAVSGFCSNNTIHDNIKIFDQKKINRFKKYNKRGVCHWIFPKTLNTVSITQMCLNTVQKEENESVQQRILRLCNIERNTHKAKCITFDDFGYFTGSNAEDEQYRQLENSIIDYHNLVDKFLWRLLQ